MRHKKSSFRQRKFRELVHLLAILAICLTGIPIRLTAQSQEKPATKKSDDDEIVRVNSNLVNVDVTVKDKKGKVVRDLKAEDFTITENGVKQTIEFFDATLSGNTPPEASSTATPREPTSPSAPRVLPRNVVALVLDGQTTESLNLKPVREGIIKYVSDRITDNDSVALFAIAGGLQLLQPFTQDKEKIISAVEQASSIGVGSKSLELRDMNADIAGLRDH